MPARVAQGAAAAVVAQGAAAAGVAQGAAAAVVAQGAAAAGVAASSYESNAPRVVFPILLACLMPTRSETLEQASIFLCLSSQRKALKVISFSLGAEEHEFRDLRIDVLHRRTSAAVAVRVLRGGSGGAHGHDAVEREAKERARGLLRARARDRVSAATCVSRRF